MRKPWLAALLNLLSLGLGFVYVGRARWALFTVVAAPALIGVFAWTRLMFVPLGFAVWGLAIVVLWLGSALIAWRTARRQGAVPLARYQRWYVYVIYFVVVALAYEALLGSRGSIFGYETFRFPSASMLDTLRPGDHIVSDTWRFGRHDPVRGELVVYIAPQDRSLKFVKRVIGLPGETIQMRGGEVRVDGKVLSEPYVNTAYNQGLNPPRNEYRVPAASYFVLGDNRDNSADSRQFGPVPRTDLYGSVEHIWYSRDLARIGLRLR